MLKAAGLLRDEASDAGGPARDSRGCASTATGRSAAAKISKSVGNVVEALALTRKYGNDAFRYFVLREMPFGQDANFSEEALVERLNADLANDLGNLVSRATTMIVNFGAQTAGATPTPEAADDAIRTLVGETGRAVEAAMAEFAFQRALVEIWSFIGAVNRYVDAARPWALAKDPAQQGRLAAVLATLGAALRYLGIVLEPFVPDAAARIRAAVGDARPPALGNTVAEPGARSARRAAAVRALPPGGHEGAGGRRPGRPRRPRPSRARPRASPSTTSSAWISGWRRSSPRSPCRSRRSS